MTVANRTVRHRASPGARVADVLRGWERRLGADRPGRSGLVWLGPLITAVTAFAMLAWFAHSGGVGIEEWLPRRAPAVAVMSPDASPATIMICKSAIERLGLAAGPREPAV